MLLVATAYVTLGIMDQLLQVSHGLAGLPRSRQAK